MITGSAARQPQDDGIGAGERYHEDGKRENDGEECVHRHNNRFGIMQLKVRWQRAEPAPDPDCRYAQGRAKAGSVRAAAGAARPRSRSCMRVGDRRRTGPARAKLCVSRRRPGTCAIALCASNQSFGQACQLLRALFRAGRRGLATRAGRGFNYARSDQRDFHPG